MESAPRGLFVYVSRLLVVPLASHHAKVGASFCAEVNNLVVTAVNIYQSLVERNIKSCELVVVAKQTLEEVLA